MSNYEKMMAQNQGWRDGACCAAMKPGYTNHKVKEVRDIYEDGYVEGRAARSKANTAHAKRFKVTLHQIQTSILR